MDKLRNGLCILTLTLAPFIFLKIGAVNITIFDLMFVFVACLYVFKGFNLDGNYQIYYIAVWCFLVFSWASVYNSSDHMESIFTTTQYTFVLLFLFPTISKVLTFDLYKKIVFSMSFAWCIFSIFNMPLLRNPEYLWGGGAGRYVGFFSEPGETGLLSSMMTPFLLYGLFTLKAKNRLITFLIKVLFLCGTVSNLVVLVASGSRSAVISFIVGMFLLLIMKYGLSLKLIATSLLFVVLGIVIQSTLSFERNALSRLSTNENVGSRINDYGTVLDVLKEYFFFGTGLGDSLFAIQKFGGVYRPHNMFLDILIESGVLGFIALLIILGLCLFFGVRILWNVLLNKKKANFLVSVTFATGVILFIYQQFNTIANHRGYWLMWAFCLWMSTQSKHFYLDADKVEKKRKIRFVWR